MATENNSSNIEKLHIPPHSIEAEQSVLGSLMISADAWDKVADLIVAEDFYNHAHRVIYRGIIRLINNNKSVDIVTLKTELEAHNELDAAGGYAYLIELAKNTPSAANVAAYANAIRERAVIRELIGVAHDIADVGFNPEGREAKEVLDYAETKVFEIAEKRTSSSEGPVDVKSVLKKTVDRLDELAKQDQEVTGVSSGYTDLDKMTSGLQRSDLIIVAARPSMGKCIVSGSQLVNPETGALQSIDHMVENKISGVSALNHDFSMQKAKASHFVDDGIKPVFKITTALGKVIETTLTHPFLSGNGWQPLAKLSSGDKIAVPRAMPIFGNKKISTSLLSTLGFLVTGRVNAKGDCFVFNNRKAAQLAQQAFAESSGQPLNLVKTSTGFALSIKASVAPLKKVKNLCAWMQQLAHQTVAPLISQQAQFFSGNDLALGADLVPFTVETVSTKTTKEVLDLQSLPQQVVELTKDQLEKLLTSIFSACAQVQVENQIAINLRLKNQGLARQIQHLLLRFGIVAHYVEVENSHQICLRHHESLLVALSTFSIAGQEHLCQQALETLRTSRKCSLQESLPASLTVYADQIAQEAGLPTGINSLHQLQGLATRLNDEYLNQMANADIYWDEIKSIEFTGHKQVYDLTVPELHNFIAQDICVHNTTFAMNLCENAMMMQDKPVLVFSLEMPSEQIMMRMLASLSRVNQTSIRTAKLADTDWARLQQTMKELHDKDNLYIDDSSGLTPMELRTRARKLARERGGLSLIMVDYLQLMRVPSLSDNRTLEIAEISRSLKALAKELEVPVVALSQLNRGLEQRADKRPINSDLRESGSIEQDADLIMFIYRDEVYHENSEYKGIAEIIIGKQRNGPIGTCRLTFQGQFSRFDNYAGPAFEDEY